MSQPPETAQVIFLPAGRRGPVPRGTTLLAAAQQLGVAIESICGGRLTCQKCRIRVEEGRFPRHGIRSAADHLSPPAAAELALLGERAEQERLACAAAITGDLLIYIPEESRAQKQIIRKSATERAIDIAPAVRQLYVTVDQAALGEHRGDWGRLQAALAEQWQLTGLTIDLPALRALQPALRQGGWAVTVTLWQEQEVIDVRPGYEEGVYGLAVDVGSTTVAGYLCDLRTGAILAAEASMNPQVTFGEDLMSRISYAMMHRDGLARLHAAIIDTLNRLAAAAARAAGLAPRQIQEMVAVGNTTMISLLLNIDPTELGQAPFPLANQAGMNWKARDLGLRLHPGAYLHILPAQAGHVGADNVAALLAEPLDEAGTGDGLDGPPPVTLLVDIGTNAEIVLSAGGRLFSASSPTGPAFEGAQISGGMRAAPGAIERVRIDPETGVARFRLIGDERWSDAWPRGPDAPPAEQPRHLAAGICGSGIVEVVAELYLAGILRGDGRFNPDCQSDRLQWPGRAGVYVLATADETANGQPLLVTQADVRNVQLAKAALYAGAKLLLARAGVTAVDRILLAGAFGSYIDPRYAMILGLIPDCPLERVIAVGNAAGDGARIALLNRFRRREAEQLAQRVRYVETAVDPDFQAEFVAALHIPHAADPFPHLAGQLPEPAALAAPSRPGRERRSRRSAGGGA